MLKFVFLSKTTIPICCRSYILNVDITLVVQIAQQFFKGFKTFLDVLGFLFFGIGLINYFDIKVKATFTLLR